MSILLHLQIESTLNLFSIVSSTLILLLIQQIFNKKIVSPSGTMPITFQKNGAERRLDKRKKNVESQLDKDGIQ